MHIIHSLSILKEVNEFIWYFQFPKMFWERQKVPSDLLFPGDPLASTHNPTTTHVWPHLCFHVGSVDLNFVSNAHAAIVLTHKAISLGLPGCFEKHTFLNLGHSLHTLQIHKTAKMIFVFESGSSVFLMYVLHTWMSWEFIAHSGN